MSMHGLTLNITKSMQTNKVDGQTLTVEKYFVALIIYMNVVNVPRLADCRSTAHLFAHGTSQLFQTLSPKLAF